MIPGALDRSLQRRLIMDALSAYLEPPSNTNHTRCTSSLHSNSIQENIAWQDPG
jgi:hypothetical protein